MPPGKSPARSSGTTTGPSTRPEVSRGTNKYQHNLASSREDSPVRYVQVHGQIQPLYMLTGDKRAPKHDAPRTAHRLIVTMDGSYLRKSLLCFHAPHFHNLATEKSLSRKLLTELFLQTCSLFFNYRFKHYGRREASVVFHFLCCVAHFISERNLRHLRVI